MVKICQIQMNFQLERFKSVTMKVVRVKMRRRLKERKISLRTSLRRGQEMESQSHLLSLKKMSNLLMIIRVNNLDYLI